MIRMSRSIAAPLSWLRGLTLIAVTSTTLPASAQGYLGQGPELLARYRCGVLGDSSQCAPTVSKPSVHEEERVVLGPRAKYLIHLGVEPSAAVAQARLSGEIPVREKVRITTRRLSSAEAFDRANGRAVAAEQMVEVLSSTAVTAESNNLAPRS